MTDLRRGALYEENGRFVLRFTQPLAHPPEKVWRALTDPTELGHWFPQRVETDLRVGGRIRFSSRHGEHPPFEGEILRVEPPRLFVHRWGTDVLRWEPHPDGEGCRLVFTDTFAEGGKAARDGAGWHVCLESLRAWLDGTAPPPADRWTRVHPEYVESFGPQAATIGPPAAAG